MWTTVSIGGKPADVFDLPGGRPRFGLLYLHPYGLETLPTLPVWTQLLQEHRFVCVCPHGQHSWWADRVCAEFDAHLTAERYLLDAVVPFFMSRWNLPPRALGL